MAFYYRQKLSPNQGEKIALLLELFSPVFINSEIFTKAVACTLQIRYVNYGNMSFLLVSNGCYSKKYRIGRRRGAGSRSTYRSTPEFMCDEGNKGFNGERNKRQH